MSIFREPKFAAFAYACQRDPDEAMLDRLELAPDVTEADPSEEVRVMIRARDQAGNKLHFLNEPVFLTVEGPATLIGPDCPVLQGGATGCWPRLTGYAGTIRVMAWLRDRVESVEIAAL